MSGKIRREEELALLTDLARLVTKYGPGVFQDLAESLEDPKFVERIRVVLLTVAANSPDDTERGRARRPSRDRLAGAEARLAEVDSPAAAALRSLVEAVSAGEPLPRLKDVKAFAMQHGLPVPGSNSRREAVARLVNVVLALPPEEVAALTPELESLVRSDDRSLEGWLRIIKRSRDELTEPDGK
jgi:hypothetical protein